MTAIAALMVCQFSSVRAADEIPPVEMSSLVVKMIGGLSTDEEAACIARDGGVEVSSIQALRMHVIAIPTNELEEAILRYKGDPYVESVELNMLRNAQGAPSDLYYPYYQWALPKIGWDLVFDAQAVSVWTTTVALLDTGVDADHPDLSGHVITGTSILDGSGGLSDPNGHGTWLAGIIAANTNNDIGIAGVGYSGVNIMPVTVIGPDGTGQDSDIIAGIVWAADHGADVILMGFSNPGFSQHLQDAIDYAWAKGAVLVAPTGNESSDAPTFPAGDRGVMGVSATDRDDNLAYFSNYGSTVFLAAPGVEIVTTNSRDNTLGNDYVTFGGTSASSAVVAGVAAFMKSIDPTLTNGVIVGRLARTADPAGTQEQTGNGRVNMARALEDTSTDGIQPAGITPAGDGGPYVGPYEIAARNWVLTFAGSGSGSVTITPSSGTVNAPVSCGGTGTNAASQTVTGTCSPNITTSENAATVTFSASAGGGSAFAGWSGQAGLSPNTCSGTTNPCSAVLGPSATLTVTFNTACTAPSITTQPSSQTKVFGESVTFSVTASGTAPLSYQWRKDGINIGGATSSSYTISSVLMADAGSYDVVVSNSCGSALPVLNQALTLAPPAGQPAGSATYLRYPGGQLLSQANGTIEFWVSLASYGTGVSLVDQGPFYGSCAGWTFAMGVNSTGQLNAGAWAAFNMNSGTTTVPLNTWTHVAATWGSSGAKLYINGIQVGSDTNTGMPASGFGGSVLMRLGTHAGFNARIDELRISNIQRTTFSTIPSGAGTATPYTSDSNTILLNHFNGSTSASILAYNNNGQACGSALPSAIPTYFFVDTAAWSTAATLTVDKADTTTTITSDSPDPSVVGESYTVAWTVSVDSPGSGTPTGTVTITGGSGCSAAVEAGGCTVTSTDAGAKTLTATYSGDADFNGSFNTEGHTVDKATPTITWSNPADITYGTALDGTQLNATASVAGSFVYTPAAGTILNAGSGQTLSADFTPTDTANYNTASASVLINVTARPITVTANAQAKVYGDSDPALTYTVTSGSLVSGDSFSGALTRATGENVGTYAIIQDTLALSSNYDLTYVGADLTITARPITVTADAKSKTFGDADPTLTFTVGGSGLAAGDTIASVFSGALTRVPGESVAGSPYAITQGTLAANSNYNITGFTGADLTITPAPTVSTVTVTPNPRQYSDKVTFTATLSPISISGLSPATTVTFKVGTQIMGSCALAPSGGVLTCQLTDVPLLEPIPFGTSPTGQMAPGSRTVTAVFGGVDPNFTVNDATTTLTINKEDARAYYTGATFASTSCATCNTATVTLAVTVQDITATPDAAGDADFGDIRNATVTFVNRDASDAVLCTAPGVGLVTASDTKTGTATCSWTANIGSGDSQSYTIGIIVNNYYARNSSDDNTVVTVSKPLNNFITGGGYLVLSNSAGLTPGAPGTKNNFGFNVKYNKSKTNLQGNINTIVRSTTWSGACPVQPGGVYVYQVKGNAMTSLSVNTSTGKAIFNGKANIRDITNPLSPCSVDGNATLQVTMDDNGEPGKNDTIGITVWRKSGGLWFSSNWTGTTTVEQLLGGGNLVTR